MLNSRAPRASLDWFTGKVLLTLFVVVSMAMGCVGVLFLLNLWHIPISAWGKFLVATFIVAIMSFVAANWMAYLSSRKLGSEKQGTQERRIGFGAGPRPTNPDEVSTWWWRRVAWYCWLAAMVCLIVMIASAFTGLLDGTSDSRG